MRENCPVLRYPTVLLAISISLLFLPIPSDLAADPSPTGKNGDKSGQAETFSNVPSLSTVLASATTHHPKIVAALEKIQSARGSLTSAQGAFDPMINVNSIGYGSGYYEGSNSTSSRFTVPLEAAGTNLFLGGRSGQGNFPIYEDEYDTLDIGDLGGGARISVLRGREIDKRRTALRVGELELSQSDLQGESARLFVLEEASLAYWKWIISHAQVHIYEELLKIGTARQSQFDERVKLGDMAAIDALDNSRTILERQEKLIEQKQKLRLSSQVLSLYYRDGDGEPIELPEISLKSSALSKSSLPKLIQSSLEIQKIANDISLKRPDIRELDNEIQQLELNLQLARNDELPSLDLESTLTRDYGDGEISRDGTEWKGMLRFELPLYRREARGRQSALEADIRAKKAERRLLIDKISTALSASLEILKRNAERYQVLKREVSVTEQLERAEWEKFNSGASNLLFVAMRELNTASVRSRMLDSLLENRATWNRLATLTAAPHLLERE